MRKLIDIKAVCVILGVGFADEPSDAAKTMARTVCKFFGVHQENVYDDKAPRARFHCVYDREAVENIAAIRRQGVLP